MILEQTLRFRTKRDHRYHIPYMDLKSDVVFAVGSRKPTPLRPSTGKREKEIEIEL